MEEADPSSAAATRVVFSSLMRWPIVALSALPALVAACNSHDDSNPSDASGAADAPTASSLDSTVTDATGAAHDGTVGDAPGTTKSDATTEDSPTNTEGPDGASTSGDGSDAGLEGVADAAIVDSGIVAAAQDGAYNPVPEGTYVEPTVTSGDSVLRHHKNLNHDGAYIEPALTKAAIAGQADAGLPGLHQDTSFQAVLGANDYVYAQPLFVDGLGVGPDMLLVATEGDNVYALDPATGTPLWTTPVGTPVPPGAKGCGNLPQYGITGTPVIDFASRTIFFDAEVMPPADAGTADGAAPGTKHEIFALSIDDGSIRPGWPVDVGAIAVADDGPFNPMFQGQRGALTILDGTLYVPYGGLYGECGTYHGYIVAVSISDPTHVQTWSTTLGAGGMWAPGGITSDGTAIFVATGNTQGYMGNRGLCPPASPPPWGGGDGVLRFGVGSAFGTLQDYFAPYNWLTLDCTDQGLGADPIPFDLPNSNPSHLVIDFGKDGNAYLLDRTRLGGIATSLLPDAGDASTPIVSQAGLHVATAQIITAPAVYATNVGTYVTLFSPAAPASCAGTDTAAWAVVPGSPPTLSFAWCGLANGSGSPIATTSDGHSDAVVWRIGAENDGHLHAFDGDTGAVIHFPASNVVIPNTRRFSSPIVAKGRIYAAGDGNVVAFTP
jgi:outer membrane protein assembly factor BamB